MNIYLFCYEGPRRGSRYRDHGKGDRERVPSGSGGYHAGDSCHNVAGEHLFTLVQPTHFCTAKDLAMQGHAAGLTD